jgi:type II secretory pathway pseudopilin PulG
VSYATCPRCGNPTNGAQRVAAAGGAGSTNTAGLVIGLVIGGVVLVAVLGILAAIAIPNLLTAMQRSKQKRTMADMRTVLTAVEAYASDKNGAYPKGGQYVAELESQLTPTYARKLPAVDGWGMALKYECSPSPEQCEKYAIGSAGSDQQWEHESLFEYSEAATGNFAADLVIAGGQFVQHPEGLQNQ